jgi:thiol-disulfide isomerase/thioredoxin
MNINQIKGTILTICLALLQLYSFAANNDCTVNGKIKGIEKEAKIFVLRRVGEHGIDTVKQSLIKSNGDFSFVISAKDCDQLYDLQIDGVRGTLSFFAEKGNLEISAIKGKFYEAALTGTAANVQWTNYQKTAMVITMKSNQMMMSGEAAKLTKEAKVAFYKGLENERKHCIDSLIKNYPNAVLSLYLAKVPLMMMKHQKIDSLLTIFKPYFAKHPYFVEMKTRADILRRISAGAIAPDFNVFQPDGKSKISLSSFRGKYVMLDFWASWCVPCRAENVHTKELYEKFHPYGLEVISFSLDHEIGPWNEALKKDGLIWNNASDLIGGVKSPVAKKYGIDGIPAIWIIDPNGKIIAEGVRGEALAKILESIFVKTKG